ncbi:MAG: hypothetical protein ACW96X_02090 [Promethearchaeota archaeon]|jgi:hypothetical protein
MLFQLDPRVILIPVVQGIMIIYFLSITYQILKRRRQRLNLIFACFFICTIIGNVLNIIYFLMTNENVILIFNFLTNFFFLLGPIFILTVNRIILESTIIYPVKRQNLYILLYGVVLLLGMLILVLLGLVFDPSWPSKPILGLTINPNTRAPVWGLVFLIYVISFSAALVVIPIIRTSLKIYASFETKELKKKWRYYFIGSLGAFSIFYLIIIANWLDNINFKNIVSFYGISVLLWVSFMYYGIGFKLKT